METPLESAFKDPRRYALNKKLENINRRRFRKTPLFFAKLASVYILSLVLDLALSFLTLRNRFRKRGGYTRILLIKLDHIGDIVMATPAIRALKTAFPAASLSVMVGPWAKDVLANNPYVDELIFYTPWWNNRDYSALPLWKRIHMLLQNLRVLWQTIQKGFDLSVNLKGDYGNVWLTFLTSPVRVAHHNFTPYKFLLTHKVDYDGTKHELERHGDLLRALLGSRVRGDLEKLDLYPSSEDEKVIQTFLRERGVASMPCIGIHPGSGAPLNRWPAESFAEVADYLTEHYGVTVIFVGGQEETELASRIQSLMRHRCIDATGKTSILQLAAIMRHLQLFLCNDGGPMHVADAMEVPILALFGPSPMHHFRPLPPRARILKKDVPCSPCPQFVPGLKNECPGNLCMRLITPHEVIAAAAQCLSPLRLSEARP